MLLFEGDAFAHLALEGIGRFGHQADFIAQPRVRHGNLDIITRNGIQGGANLGQGACDRPAEKHGRKEQEGDGTAADLDRTGDFAGNECFDIVDIGTGANGQPPGLEGRRIAGLVKKRLFWLAGFVPLIGVDTTAVAGQFDHLLQERAAGLVGQFPLVRPEQRGRRVNREHAFEADHKDIAIGLVPHGGNRLIGGALRLVLGHFPAGF